MVIRPMAAAYSLGEFGRSAAVKGGKGGSTSFFAGTGDTVSFGGKSGSAGLYSAAPLFKIMGAVELMSEDFEAEDNAAYFGDNPVLL